MKKLIVIALLLVGTTIIAQERNRKQHGDKMEQFTPEQQSQLMLKKMTLELDLNDAQQKEMTSFISDKMAKKALSVRTTAPAPSAISPLMLRARALKLKLALLTL